MKKAQLVRELMQTDVIRAKAEQSIGDIAKLMRDHDVGFIPIVTETNDLLGVVTDRDLVIRGLATSMPASTAVKQVMTQSQLKTVAPDTAITTAASCMGDGLVRRLPVVEHNRLVGIVTLGDVAQCDALMNQATHALHHITEHQPV